LAVSNKIIDAVPALGNYIGIFNQLAALGKFDMMLDVLTSMCSDDNVRGKLERLKVKSSKIELMPSRELTCRTLPHQ